LRAGARLLELNVTKLRVSVVVAKVVVDEVQNLYRENLSEVEHSQPPSCLRSFQHQINPVQR
jgi:hypothetical protein